MYSKIALDLIARTRITKDDDAKSEDTLILTYTDDSWYEIVGYMGKDSLMKTFRSWSDEKRRYVGRREDALLTWIWYQFKSDLPSITGADPKFGGFHLADDDPDQPAMVRWKAYAAAGRNQFLKDMAKAFDGNRPELVEFRARVDGAREAWLRTVQLALGHGFVTSEEGKKLIPKLRDIPAASQLLGEVTRAPSAFAFQDTRPAAVRLALNGANETAREVIALAYTPAGSRTWGRGHGLMTHALADTEAYCLAGTLAKAGK